MKVWVTSRTRDSCNGCPWQLLGLSATQELAIALAEERAAPYIPFGQPKLRRPPALNWYLDIGNDVSWADPPPLIAPSDGEHYVIYLEQVRG